MSSLVVGTDHIDYLVTAACTYAADIEGVRDRDAQALATFLYRENIATAVGLRPWPVPEGRDPFDDLEGDVDWHANIDAELGDEPDPEMLGELMEERDVVRASLDGYVHRPVVDVEPAQAALVASCWLYQRVRNGPDHEPPSWRLVETVRRRCLAAVPDDQFSGTTNDRSTDDLVARSSLAWVWRRPQD